MSGRKIEVRRDGHILVVLLNRPAIYNAFDPEMLQLLHAVLSGAERDVGVRSVVVTGAGPSFCSGSDVRALARLTPTELAAYLGLETELLRLLRQLPPVIAAIEGHAVAGGLHMALACDLRVAGVGAQFASAGVRLGMVPACGATVLLPRLIGDGAARDVFMTARIIDDEEALRLGLVSAVAPCGRALEVALERARDIAGHGPVAMRRIKTLLNAAVDCELEDGLAREREANNQVMRGSEVAEGMRAFREKRPPAYDDPDPHGGDELEMGSE